MIPRRKPQSLKSTSTYSDGSIHVRIIFLTLALALMPGIAAAERIKDLAAVAGVRDNQLLGYGLVVGLDGTGDQTTQTPFTIQAIRNMLNQLGIVVPDNVNPQLKNVAAVMVHATLPPFAKPGSTIDVTVSSMGNAKSLRGGALIMTPLKGADGGLYAMAQGNLVVGGFGASTNDGSRISVNVPSVGRIPNGATVEREVPTAFLNAEFLTFNLHRSDFTTANRMAQAIDETLGPNSAVAVDGSSVRVLSGGNTVVVPKQSIDVEQEQSRMFLFNPGVSLDSIVEAVNNVGAAPGDLVAILEALKEAGALRAELIII